MNNTLFSDKILAKVSKFCIPGKKCLCMYVVLHAHKNKAEWLSSNQAQFLWWSLREVEFHLKLCTHLYCLEFFQTYILLL